VDYLVVPESRGYILGGVFAAMQGCGLVIARKSGKTPPPFDVVSADSEYATSEYHFPSELDLEGKKVAIYDDVIATGSTIESLVNFVRTKGGNTVQIVSVLVIDSLVGDNMNTATQELFDIPLTTVKHC
jgi:adenine phosphoribosyltransferase